MRARHLAVLSAAVVSACADSSNHGDYVVPPGFDAAQTARATLAPAAFVTRGETILTATAAARLDRRAPQTDRHVVEATLLGTYADGLRVAAGTRPDAWVDVVPLHGAARSRARLRGDGAMVAFEDAFPRVTSVLSAASSRVEEFLSVAAPEDMPELAYRLRPGPGFGRWTAGSDGSFYAFDANGEGILALRAPVVEDARGDRVVGRWVMREDGTDRVVTAEIATEGLAFPLLVDPTFDAPEWFDDDPGLPGLVAPAAAYVPAKACTIVFGGAGAGWAPQSTTYLHCSTGWITATNVASTGSTVPTARAYAALSAPAVAETAGGSAVDAYLFGGTDGNGYVLDEMYAASITSLNTTAKTATVTWTKMSPTAAPSRRIMHGMSVVRDTSAGLELALFGGVASDGTILNDVWYWNPTNKTWTQHCDGAGSCFPGSYGFAVSAKTALDDGVYTFGGWNGSFGNGVSKWDGTKFATQTIASSILPTTADGSLSSSTCDADATLCAPAPRYVAWAARSSTNGLLVGSGVSEDASGNDAYQSDIWWYAEPDHDWRRFGIWTDTSLNMPGDRESPAVVYEDARNQIVLFGGGQNASTNAVTNTARIFKPVDAVQVSFAVTSSGGKNNLQYTLTMNKTKGNGQGRQGYFVYRDKSSKVWTQIPKSGNSDCGSPGAPLGDTNGNGTITCKADGLLNVDYFAVRYRYTDYYSTTTTGCTAHGTTSTVLCNPSTAFDGLAACDASSGSCTVN